MSRRSRVPGWFPTAARPICPGTAAHPDKDQHNAVARARQEWYATMTLPDPLGFILTTIRDDAAVSAITTRIRGGQPATGDALGPGKYQRFVVLSRLGGLRLKRAPLQEVRLLAKCYGVTDQDAEALAGTVSDAIHASGRLTNGSGLVITGAFDDGGEGATQDPDTGQPMASIVIQVGALDRLLT